MIKKGQPNTGFSYKVKFFKFFFLLSAGLPKSTNYKVAPHIPENKLVLPSYPKTNSPFLQIPKTPGGPLSRPSVISNGSFNEGQIMSRLHGSNVLDLRLLHCLCYPEFPLGNKASNHNGAAIMLLWWSRLTRIFTLI